MKFKPADFRALMLGVAGAVLLANAADAAEVRVMISGGLTAAYNALVPEFERATGNKVITAYGPSMGTTVNAIPIRLQRGEPADVLIMVGYALGDLVKQSKVVADSRVDLVKSPIGIAVRSGAPKPDISSADAVKRALLAAKSIAYSDSASGVYVSTEMFQRLGIADAMKDKAKMIPAEPVAGVVARGDAEIGLPADQRDAAGARRRYRRPIAARPAEDHGVFGRDCHRFQRARCRKGADQISCFTGRKCRHRQERHGADPGRRDQLGREPIMNSAWSADVRFGAHSELKSDIV